ncbi:MAG: hypothetical protein IKV94_05095 [Clostridia bacterium]|nr:hypothetical protein [Clostridia bacterium]
MLENNGNLAAITEDTIKQRMATLGIEESELQGITLSIDNGVKVQQNQTGTNSSTITNTGVSLVNYKIYGNSIQNGVPTPESPVEIQSVGDKTKNLFNQFTTKTASFSAVSNSSARTFEEGVWYRGLTYNNYSYPQNLLDYNVGTSTTMVKVNGQLLYGLAQAFKVEPKQIYSFSYDGGEGGNVALGFYDKEGKILSYKYWTYGSTINIPANAYWMTICLSGSTANIEISYSNIQLVLGTESTSYEPYGYKIPIKVTTDGNTTLHNIYLAEPLRKLGEEKDYIDFEKGQIVRKIGKAVYDENSNWTLQSASYWFESGVTTAFYTQIPVDALANSQGLECLSNLFKFDSTSDGINKSKPYISGNIGNLVVNFNNEKVSSLEQLETYLTQTKLEIVYKLNSPVYKNIKLPGIYTTKGTTSIAIDTEISPSEFVLNYEYK